MDGDFTATANASGRLINLSSNKDVEFQDVYYNVKHRINFMKPTVIQEILRGVSGSFRHGQLSAIMGPSGAGKSSLLNAISGYQTVGVSGHIKVRRKESCYITQEDNHQTLLTVEELMAFSYNLKFKDSSRKDELITEILEHLLLNNCRNVMADKLSGGERKRLSIALEMVANPNVFFLDEPTSGLDEVTAVQCIKLLSTLAKQGRTIVCTIHQPSPTIFNSFDHIYVLAKGQCVYQGAPNALLPFMTRVQIDCPKNYSPSDYIIELCDADDGQLIPLFSTITDNGKLIYAPNLSETAWTFYQAVTTLFVEKSRRNRFFTILSTTSNGSLIEGANVLREHMKSFTKQMQTDSSIINNISSSTGTSSFQQFLTIFHVMLLRIVRARVPLVIQFAHHILCGVFFGMIFLKAANEGERMFDHIKFCIGAVLVIVYTQVMVPVLSFPGEVKIVKKETFNRWYSLTPYYFALNVSRIPLQIIHNLLFLGIIYWMSGLPNQFWRFCLFAVAGQMTSFVAEGLGLTIGATFSITNGSAVGPMVLAPLMFIAVYGLDFAAQVPHAVDILMKFTFIRASVISFILCVFGFDRPTMHCSEVYCHFGDPKVILKFVGCSDALLSNQLFVLGGLFVFLRILLYLSLRRRCCS